MAKSNKKKCCANDGKCEENLEWKMSKTSQSTKCLL